MIARGVSYFGNRILRHYIERDLPDILDHQCTYVLHTFSENDLKYYRDSMKKFTRITHDQGLEVYLDPWGVGGVFGGEAFSTFLLENRLTWQVTDKGTPVPAACLNSPKFRSLMRTWIDAAIELEADVVFWDEPHLYPSVGIAPEEGEWTCACFTCRDLFEKRYHKPMPQGVNDEVSEFQDDTIVGFLQDICDYSKSKGIRNAVCLSPLAEQTPRDARWEKVAGIESLDILGVTPFWVLSRENPEEFVGLYSRKIVNLTDRYGLQPQVWLQAFQIPFGREKEFVDAAEVAVRSGIQNVGVWGFQGCAHMSALSSERPELVWELVGDTFRDLRFSI